MRGKPYVRNLFAVPVHKFASWREALDVFNATVLFESPVLCADLHYVRKDAMYGRHFAKDEQRMRSR